MKIEIGTLVRITDTEGTCWYGFFATEDKEKGTKVRRIKLNACLSNGFGPLATDNCGNIPILPCVITNIQKVELTTPEIQTMYNQLLIEASEWKSQTLF